MQAGIFFRWINWMVQNVPAGKKPLFINMDETSVAFAYPGQKGNVAQQQHIGRPLPGSYTEKASLSIRRGNVTYCAFIASEMSMQSRLPQIILGNKKKFTKKVMRAAWAEQPNFVQTWTAETGWINQSMMRKIITVLHNCLKDHINEYQIIFVVDAARCHIHKEIVNHACRHEMWMLYVPAKMTWLLQPLDAYVFAGFKALLKQQYADPEYVTEKDNMLSIAWLRRLWHSIEHKVQGLDWKTAFSKVGLLNQQHNISEHVARFTKTPSQQTFGCCMPSPAELQYMLGGKLGVPHFQLTRPVLLRRTGSLANLWPVAVPRHYDLRARIDLSGSAAAPQSHGLAAAVEPPCFPATPWPRATRLGKSSQRMKSANMATDKIKTEPSSQVNQESHKIDLTKPIAPRATRMWPSQSKLNRGLAETKKEALEQMTP